MSNFNELIKQFGDATGLTGMSLDDNGICRIVIDGSTTIDFELNSKDDTLLLIGHVVTSVSEADDDVVEASLILNAEIASNKGRFLAYDEAEDKILLLRLLDDKAMHYGEFEKTLNAFVAYIDHCRTVLLSEGDDEGDDDVEGGDDDEALANPAQAASTGSEMMMFRV